MKISELMEQLGQIQGEHGDIEIAVHTGWTLKVHGTFIGINYSSDVKCVMLLYGHEKVWE